MTDFPWHRALALAVSGRDVDFVDTATVDLEVLGDGLAAAGFDLDALRAHRDACWAQGTPWPHPVAADRRGGLGAAQFFAALAEVRHAWQLDEQKVARPAVRKPLTADDRRLLAEVPPHHVLH